MGHVSKKTKSSAGRFMGFSRIAGAQDGKTESYMTRLWIGRLRLHIFHRGDQDPDCHDHPWPFWTFPFRSYVEEVVEFSSVEGSPEVFCERRLQVVKAFRLHYRPARHTHRVLGALTGYKLAHEREGFSKLVLKPTYEYVGTIPTLVWRGAPERSWGFLCKRDSRWCWTPWKRYVFADGKTAPCDDHTN